MFSMGYTSKNLLMPEVIRDRLLEIVPSHSSFVGYHTRKPPKSKTFRKSMIGDIISFFVSAYSFSPSSCWRDRSSVTSLCNAHHERKLPSANADEDWRSVTSVFSSDFISTSFLLGAEFWTRRVKCSIG
jgi:hypothetical protein